MGFCKVGITNSNFAPLARQAASRASGCRHIPARQGQPRGAGPTMHFGSDFGVVAQQRIGIRQIGQGPQAVGQGGDVGCRVDGDRVILQGSCAFYMEGQIEVPD